MAAEYFQSEIGKELDWEDHTASIEDFAKAPFVVYIAEQKLGDLVLVPPRSSHQVVNHGGLTVKTSWSRMTVAGLTTALYHELPLYRRYVIAPVFVYPDTEYNLFRVCRTEQYRVKYILYRALSTMTDELRQHAANATQQADTLAQIRTLIKLFDFVLHEEYSSHHHALEVLSEGPLILRLPNNHRMSTRLETKETPPSLPVSTDGTPELPNIACDFCGSDIFQSFFECSTCHEDGPELAKPGHGLIICPTCYIEGRSCVCKIMAPKQYRGFSKLLEDRNLAADVLNGIVPEAQQLVVLTEQYVLL